MPGACMRLTDFWDRMHAVFGESYAHSWSSDVVVPELGCTVDDALSRGDDAKAVWRAVCACVEVPSTLT